MNKLEIHNNRTFEDIKHIDENGVEFWLDRELMQELEYTKWGNFKNVINKAIEVCKNSNINISDHFADVGKIVKAGATTKKIEDYKLSRYGCYLIAQNGDSRKKKWLLLHKHISQFKLENKKLAKKNIVPLQKMKKDFIKEI